MGTAQSKIDTDIRLIQELDETGNFELGMLTRICTGLFIEVLEKNKDGIYSITIYYDNCGFMTYIYSFQSFHQLRKTCLINFKHFPIVEMIFQTESYFDDSEKNNLITISVDFSSSFKKLSEFGGMLKSIPDPLPEGLRMKLLDDSNPDGPYFYYYSLSSGKSHSFYIVSSSTIIHRSSGFGSEKKYEKGDSICLKYIVCSEEIPFIGRDSDDNLAIRSADMNFVPVKIELPTEEMTRMPGFELLKEEMTSMPGFELSDEEMTSMPGFGLPKQELTSMPGFELSDGELTSMPGFELLDGELTRMPGFRLPDKELTSMPNFEFPEEEERYMSVFGLPDEEERRIGISVFGFPDEEEQIDMSISELPEDEEEISMMNFLANAKQPLNISKLTSFADLNRSSLIFTTGGSLGGLARRVSEIEDNFEL